MAEQTAIVLDTTSVASGTYEIDPSHSTVEFLARHLMISKVRGRFSRFSGVITVGDSPATSAVRATIEAASIDTNDEKRDAHLRSADFLDSDNHPDLEFVSTGVEGGGDDLWTVTGDLTIRGVTRPVNLDVAFDGAVTDPWGNDRIGLTASTEIDRDDWGLTWNQALESGGVVLGKKLRIELAVEAVRS